MVAVLKKVQMASLRRRMNVAWVLRKAQRIGVDDTQLVNDDVLGLEFSTSALTTCGV